MKLGELANALDLALQGSADYLVERLAPIERAGEHELAFVTGHHYRAVLESTGAGAVIVPASLAPHAPGRYLIAADPYAAYARASWLLQPEPAAPVGVHPTAVVSANATIAASATIGAHAVIEDSACIGEDVVIGAHSLVGHASEIGAGSRLFPRVTILHGCRVGERCRIQSGVVIGGDGFGYAASADGWLPIHQTGGVRIGHGVHIGANTTIDRGALDDTEIADGVILDNQIQIAHNVRIGENTAIAGCVGIAGSTRIGSRCRIGGACNIVGHLNIADGVVLNAASTVLRSIDEAGHYGSGLPVQPVNSWRRTVVALQRLEQLLRRVRSLERT